MATRKKTALVPADDLEEKTCVYLGVRVGEGNKKLSAYGVIDEHGVLVERLFAFDKTRHIGGIYSGAKFSAVQAMGLNQLRWSGKSWPKQGDILEWTSLQRHALEAIESKKLEADMARTDAIEKMLLPLRKQYHGVEVFFTGYKRSAMEHAVLSALRTPLREYEK